MPQGGPDEALRACAAADVGDIELPAGRVHQSQDEVPSRDEASPTLWVEAAFGVIVETLLRVE